MGRVSSTLRVHKGPKLHYTFYLWICVEEIFLSSKEAQVCDLFGYFRLLVWGFLAFWFFGFFCFLNMLFFPGLCG